MRQKQENRLGQTAGSDPRQKPATSGCFILPQPAGARKTSSWAKARWVQRLIKAALSLAVLRAGCAV